MAQRPRQLNPHRSGWDLFGSQLRSWREQRGLSQDALGRRVHVSGDLIGKVEKAARRPSRTLVERCDEALQARGALITALAAAEPPTGTTGLAVEADTSGEDLMAVSASLGDAIFSWRRMLSLLTAETITGGLTTVEPIVRGQLQAMAGLRAAGPTRTPTDLLVTEALWAEFLSWIRDNTGPTGDGTTWLTHAERLAARVQASVLASYILMRRSQQATERGDHTSAIGYARRAQQQPSLPAGTRALTAIREAQSLAHAGDDTTSRQKITEAYRLIDHIDAVPDDLNITGHCTLGYVAAHEAYCRLILGDPADAAARYEQVLTASPGGSALDEGLWRAHLAQAYAATGRHDQAGGQASRALLLARATASIRTLRVLGDVAVTLRRSKTTTATEFLTAYRAAVEIPCND